MPQCISAMFTKLGSQGSELRTLQDQEIVRNKDNLVVREKKGSSEAMRSISDCSWLMGLFEMEGCITRDKRIIITQKDKRLLENKVMV